MKLLTTLVLLATLITVFAQTSGYNCYQTFQYPCHRSDDRQVPCSNGGFEDVATTDGNNTDHCYYAIGASGSSSCYPEKKVDCNYEVAIVNCDGEISGHSVTTSVTPQAATACN